MNLLTVSLTLLLSLVVVQSLPQRLYGGESGGGYGWGAEGGFGGYGGYGGRRRFGGHFHGEGSFGGGHRQGFGGEGNQDRTIS